MGVCTKEREGRGSRGTRKVDLCLFSFFAKTFRPIIYQHQPKKWYFDSDFKARYLPAH